MPEATASAADVREDALMGGRVRLRQPVHGYRAGLDAALLAAAVEARPGERVLEAGCGAGAALLQAATRNGEARFTGVERDEAATALARENIALNSMDARVDVVCGDIAEGFVKLGAPRFDAAFSNPPFFDDPGAIRGPALARRGAWIADAGLMAWTGFLLNAVREGGRVTLIHRADRLADLLSTLADARGGAFRIRPVHPFADLPAKRVLVRAVRGGRSPLVLLPALVLHPRVGDGVHTTQAEAILRGEAPLGWA